MGLHVMTDIHFLLLLCSSLSSAASVSKSFLVSVRSPVLEQLGRETTLPCWLNPPQSAEALEVRWYRNHRFDTPIILYYNKKMYEIQDGSYVGRASFGLKDAASGGLAAGDVSLKLLNVGIEDEGDYTCYVSSGQHSDRGSVSLNLTKTGTTPLLSMVWAEENLVNLSCESEGWYPRPKLHWADQKLNLTPKSLEYGKVSSGLVSVHSWVLVPSSSEVSCSVGLSDVNTKEARVQLEIPPPPAIQGVQSAPGLVAVLVIFILLFLAVLALLGWLYIKKRVFQKKVKSERTQAEENKKLLQEDKMKHLQEDNNKLLHEATVQKAALEETKKEKETMKLLQEENKKLLHEATAHKEALEKAEKKNETMKLLQEATAKKAVLEEVKKHYETMKLLQEENMKLLQEVKEAALEEAKKQNETLKLSEEENMKLLQEVKKAALEEAKKHYATVKEAALEEAKKQNETLKLSEEDPHQSVMHSSLIHTASFHKCRGNQSKNKTLLQKVTVQPTALEEAKKHYVNVELEDKGNPYVPIRAGIFKDNRYSDVTAVTCLTALRGTSGFTSGQHYWEVSFWKSYFYEVKQSWWLGVTKATDFPLKGDALSSTSNGFWFLSSSPERANSFQLNTEPKVVLPVRSRPRIVGVYLNYDGGELSFYDVEDKSVIGSLTATFQGEVFPFFNPGNSDQASMKIVKQKPTWSMY